jgi:hypothetical protein
MIAFHFLERLHPLLLPLILRSGSRLPPSFSTLLSMTSSPSVSAQDEKLPSAVTSWNPLDPDQEVQAKETLEVWPLDEFNARLLNEVHPLGYVQSTPKPYEEYDLLGRCRPRRRSSVFRGCARKLIARNMSPRSHSHAPCLLFFVISNKPVTVSDWFWSRRFSLQ